MYNNILVPVNFDQCSQLAAKHAFELSRLLGGNVMLHVLAENATPEVSQATQVF